MSVPCWAVWPYGAAGTHREINEHAVIWCDSAATARAVADFYSRESGTRHGDFLGTPPVSLEHIGRGAYVKRPGENPGAVLVVVEALKIIR
jgi:hypothetical protein